MMTYTTLTLAELKHMVRLANKHLGPSSQLRTKLQRALKWAQANNSPQVAIVGEDEPEEEDGPWDFM